MEIKKNDNIIVTGRNICFAAAILATISGIYWIIRAFVDEKTELVPLLGSVTVAMFLFQFSMKKPKKDD